jgi:hypothetical protein
MGVGMLNTVSLSTFIDILTTALLKRPDPFRHLPTIPDSHRSDLQPISYHTPHPTSHSTPQAPDLRSRLSSVTASTTNHQSEESARRARALADYEADRDIVKQRVIREKYAREARERKAKEDAEAAAAGDGEGVDLQSGHQLQSQQYDDDDEEEEEVEEESEDEDEEDEDGSKRYARQMRRAGKGQRLGGGQVLGR